MGIQRFERRLERLVEGAFGKAFRSGLQPVEIGRRIAREMDAGRTLGVRGALVPNVFTVGLSRPDLERFAGFRDALERELADAARDHALEERCHFAGPVEVTLLADEDARIGDLRIEAEIVAGAQGAPGTLLMPDGHRIELGDVSVIGRLPDCAVPLSDPQVSRRHAEIQRDERGGYRVVDLGSTNGTQVNGTQIREHQLSNGDVITVGATSMRYEES